MTSLQQEVIKVLSHVKIRQEDSADAIERQREQEKARARVNYQHQAVSAMAGVVDEQQPQQSPPKGSREGASVGAERQAPFVRDVPKVGRNEQCPCGSGKKYKICHGKLG
ncbi:MAG: SEC-C metal-binding domain-containing protein, partial [Gammaproteobacteria bacterium]|jgi:preprotein translocase subunit SecA|nr:SEC-C metal-binding domain-containing protein [Gammaproteobacteria bacterium]